MSGCRRAKRLLPLLVWAALCSCQPITGAALTQPPTAVPSLPPTAQPVLSPTTVPTRVPSPTPRPTRAPTSTAAPKTVTVRIVVRAPDNATKILDTGVALDPAAPPALNGFLPLGGQVGADAYVLSLTDQNHAEAVGASGVRALSFVENADYALAVWPGASGAPARLAWGTGPSSGGSNFNTSLVVSDVDGGHLATLLTEDGNTPAPHQLVAERWSTDGQALYFSREPVGIGGYILFGGASSLYRMEMASRKVTELIPFNISGGGRFICLDAFSADERRVADHCTEKAITVRDLTSGQATTVQPPSAVTGFGALGGARFSPDGSRLAYALAKSDPSAEQGWLAVSDGLSGASRLVYTGQPGEIFNLVGWLNAQTLLMEVNNVQCSANCNTTLLRLAADGSGKPVTVGEGMFLALAGAQP
jgi:hypothetical protein